jgi:peptide methionine sulfoxide reductase msrA/msrB
MRITHPDKRSIHRTLLLGLLGVVVVLGGVFFLFSRAQNKKQEPGQTGYLRPVPSDSALRSELTDVQYHVTRENGTETAFQNMYWNNFRPGIYVDVITNEPLFSSRDKFEANTGRPCFTKPISPERIVQRRDTSHDMDRVEVRAARSDSHLGHVFNDGPPPTGLRYAINSAALKFVPLETMQAQGYGEFIPYVTPETGQPNAISASPASK